MVNTLKTTIKLFWLAPVFILLVVGCTGQLEEMPISDTQEAKNRPSVIVSDTPEILAEVTEPAITGPAPVPRVPFSLPSSPYQMPLDLAVLEPSNIPMLEPFGLLTFDMISTFIPDASIASSRSGYSLAAHFDDGALAVWEVASGDVLALEWSKRGGGHTGSYAALDISPGSEEYLATSATVLVDDTGDLQSAVYLWEMDDLGEPIMLPGTSLYGDRYIDPMGVMSVAFSPDGSLLAAGLRLGEGQGGLIRIWDVSDRVLIQELVLEEAVSDVSFSPERLLLVSSDNDLIYVDPTSGEVLQKVALKLSSHGHTISPIGNWLAIYGDQLTLLEVASGDVMFTLQSSDSINDVAFSPQESLLAIADGNNLRFWDLDSRVEVVNFQGQSKFLDVVFLQTGSALATIDEQSQVLLWGVLGY